ncbi:MAG: exonuclease domain-containing protein [Candidatus Kariarchaeaceae archaeon]
MINFPTEKKYIAITDFEATCSKGKSVPRDEMEIIEYATIVVDKELIFVEEFAKFIKPVRHPVLTNFCKELTSIKQKQVDKADNFLAVFQNFQESIITKYDPLFASWGGYDKNQLIQDCKYHEIEYPFDEHLDIKRWVPKFIGLKGPRGIGEMLRYLGMEFEGTPHRGIDDVKNIIRILMKIKSKLPSSELD